MVIMPDVGSELVELGVVGDLWALLKHSEDDVLSDTVCILADLSESQLKVRTIARKIGVLPYLVSTYQLSSLIQDIYVHCYT